VRSNEDAPVSSDDTTVRRAGARPTIRDVARLAEVSVGTASKALGESGKLRAETRARVRAIAKQIGFRPNDLAHSLHRGQSQTIGVISTDSFGRFTMPIMEGLEAYLSEHRISLIMCNATDDPERETRHVETLLGKRVDGIVVTARRADPRRALAVDTPGLPVLYVFSRTEDPHAFCLVPDDEGGARLATEHLLVVGRRRLAHITGPERFEAVRLRRAGFAAALQAAGLDPNAAPVLPGVWSEAWGRDALDQLFASAHPPDGIFCGNDQIARGVIDRLREKRIDVPGQVSIVGFDNWEIIAEATRPQLTTIDMNLKQLGHEAGRCLIELIRGAPLTGLRRTPCSLVVRESCGASAGDR
jgi:LacI family transcriptional regulator